VPQPFEFVFGSSEFKRGVSDCVSEIIGLELEMDQRLDVKCRVACSPLAEYSLLGLQPPPVELVLP
jgi:hypothetical protein